ncbi:NAD(P)H-dependent oxidoreductase subunit E [Anaerolineales bacterium HSG6]|nr:NAD(P)H-dependent oxidoreductase subunit E [Anaerolineales bacterium HSG6]MDM8532811.1 NAD(P)H-dependent oxidoreductase subunit E [Anaerolineales bacterium HSG25]
MKLQTKKRLKKNVYKGDTMPPPPPELAEMLAKYHGQPDALITVLEEIQRHYGYLPRHHLEYTARELSFPLSQVFGVATFYNLFQLKPPGRHQIRVCTGTACHVGHSKVILTHLKEKLGINEDETTPDKLFTLQTVACVGACSLAPVMVVNEHTHGRMTTDKSWQAIQPLHDENDVTEVES